MEAYENSLEYRLTAYLDLMFARAIGFLSAYKGGLVHDVRSDAQDVIQTAAEQIIAAEPYAPSLGAGYFSLAAENACKNLIRKRAAERKRQERIEKAHQEESIPSPESIAAGYQALAEQIRGLPEVQRLAVAERFMGFKPGELTGTAGRTRQGIARARKALAS